MLSRSLLRQCFAVRTHSTVATSRYVPKSPRLFPSYTGSSRTYSTPSASNETSDAEKSNPDNSEPKSSDQSSKDAAKTQLEAKDTEIRELKDKYLRSVADFRNLQDRTQRDMTAARDFAISRFAKDLIDSVDNLDRALTAVPQGSIGADSTNKELKDLHGGLKMTESILMQTLAKHGLVRFDPSENGDKFDPNMHEATFMTKVDGKEDGTVFNTVQKGFTLNGRVVRAAKVGVVKNS